MKRMFTIGVCGRSLGGGGSSPLGTRKIPLWTRAQNFLPPLCLCPKPSRDGRGYVAISRSLKTAGVTQPLRFSPNEVANSGMEQWIMFNCLRLLFGLPHYLSWGRMLKGYFTPLVYVQNAQNESRS